MLHVLLRSSRLWSCFVSCLSLQSLLSLRIMVIAPHGPYLFANRRRHGIQQPFLVCQRQLHNVPNESSLADSELLGIPLHTLSVLILQYHRELHHAFWYGHIIPFHVGG